MLVIELTKHYEKNGTDKPSKQAIEDTLFLQDRSGYMTSTIKETMDHLILIALFDATHTLDEMGSSKVLNCIEGSTVKLKDLHFSKINPR